MIARDGVAVDEKRVGWRERDIDTLSADATGEQVQRVGVADESQRDLRRHVFGF